MLEWVKKLIKKMNYAYVKTILGCITSLLSCVQTGQIYTQRQKRHEFRRSEKI